jgi:hypothetical protein
MRAKSLLLLPALVGLGVCCSVLTGCSGSKNPGSESGAHSGARPPGEYMRGNPPTAGGMPGQPIPQPGH